MCLKLSLAAFGVIWFPAYLCEQSKDFLIFIFFNLFFLLCWWMQLYDWFSVDIEGQELRFEAKIS